MKKEIYLGFSQSLSISLLSWNIPTEDIESFLSFCLGIYLFNIYINTVFISRAGSWIPNEQRQLNERGQKFGRMHYLSERVQLSGV